MKREEDESAGYRHARLAGIILDELRALLRDDISDPALGNVRIANIVLSVDYRHARVHFALAGITHDPKGTQIGAERSLARATSFLRARLADSVDLKRVPDLRFVFDGFAPSDDLSAISPE